MRSLLLLFVFVCAWGVTSRDSSYFALTNQASFLSKDTSPNFVFMGSSGFFCLFVLHTLFTFHSRQSKCFMGFFSLLHMTLDC